MTSSKAIYARSIFGREVTVLSFASALGTVSSTLPVGGGTNTSIYLGYGPSKDFAAGFPPWRLNMFISVGPMTTLPDGSVGVSSTSRWSRFRIVSLSPTYT